VSSNAEDGNIFCEFKQTDHELVDIPGVNIDFSKSYHYLLARGDHSSKFHAQDLAIATFFAHQV